MMLRTIRVLDSIVTDGQGSAYACRVLGGRADDGLWEGYLEFRSSDGAVLLTPRETRQPDQVDLVYWATGLSGVYLEGALQRARDARATRPLSQSR